MSSKTTNFNLHKIDLTDAPPDITVLNQNWDTIDSKLKQIEQYNSDMTPASIGAVPLDGSVPMTGQLQTTKIFFDRSNGTYGDAGIYKANEVGDASTQIMDKGSNNKFGILTINGQEQTLHWTVGTQSTDGTNTFSGAYEIYHEGNKPTASDVGAVAKSGDTMTGTLTFQKANNGLSSIQKNHSSNADYGLVLRDVDGDGNDISMRIRAADQMAEIVTNDGSVNRLATLSYGTADLTAGTSSLATGKLYFVYE